MDFPEMKGAIAVLNVAYAPPPQDLEGNNRSPKGVVEESQLDESPSVVFGLPPLERGPLPLEQYNATVALLKTARDVRNRTSLVNQGTRL